MYWVKELSNCISFTCSCTVFTALYFEEIIFPTLYSQHQSFQGTASSHAQFLFSHLGSPAIASWDLCLLQNCRKKTWEGDRQGLPGLGGLGAGIAACWAQRIIKASPTRHFGESLEISTGKRWHLLFFLTTVKTPSLAGVLLFVIPSSVSGDQTCPSEVSFPPRWSLGRI